MIIWIILFSSVVITSFYLALRSMRSYQEKPEHFSYPYALYLIQEKRNLTEDCLNQLYQALLPKRALISFERLAKGSRNALVVYGPVPLLQPFIGDLGLLELEDYTAQTNPQDLQALEFGSSHTSGKFQTEQALQYLVNELQAEDETWLQLVLQPLHQGLEIAVHQVIRTMASETYQIAAARQKRMTTDEQQALKHHPAIWSASIRGMVVSQEYKRRQDFATAFAANLQDLGLVKLPQKYTSVELLKQYRLRNMSAGRAVSLIDHPTLQLLLRPEQNR